MSTNKPLFIFFLNKRALISERKSLLLNGYKQANWHSRIVAVTTRTIANIREGRRLWVKAQQGSKTSNVTKISHELLDLSSEARRGPRAGNFLHFNTHATFTPFNKPIPDAYTDTIMQANPTLLASQICTPKTCERFDFVARAIHWQWVEGGGRGHRWEHTSFSNTSHRLDANASAMTENEPPRSHTVSFGMLTHIRLYRKGK